MPSAGKTALGIGTSAAGGAAAGSVFGPVGTGVGAGVGALLGAIGAGQASEEEEKLKKQRDAAKKAAIVQALSNHAASLGVPTASLDLPMQTRAIEQGYQDKLADMNKVGAQDYMGMLSSLAAVGGQAKNWGGKPAPMGGEPIRNSDLYGGAQRGTGLVTDDAGILTDPMMRRRR